MCRAGGWGASSRDTDCPATRRGGGAGLRVPSPAPLPPPPPPPWQGMKGGGATPKAFPYPNTSPNCISNRQKPLPPPNRFHIPWDRSTTALQLPRLPPPPPLQAQPCPVAKQMTAPQEEQRPAAGLRKPRWGSHCIARPDNTPGTALQPPPSAPLQPPPVPLQPQSARVCVRGLPRGHCIWEHNVSCIRFSTCGPGAKSGRLRSETRRPHAPNVARAPRGPCHGPTPALTCPRPRPEPTDPLFSGPR